MINKKKLIIFCGCCSSDIIADETKLLVRATLQQGNVAYKDVPELCELAAEKNQELQVELAAATSIIIIACFPRAVKWILNAGLASVTEKDVQYFNMREQSAGEIINALGYNVPAVVDSVPGVNKSSDRVPWFPVIDYDRCVHCGQCLDFCLFGVYERDAENKVTVVNPQNCKNNCPACARICPKVAIIFPKLSESPINGAEVNDASIDKAKVALDIDEIVGDDLYTALAARQKRARRALLKRKSEAKAMEEREACKKKLEVRGRKSEATTTKQVGSDELDSLSDEELLKAACEKCNVDCGSTPNVG